MPRIHIYTIFNSPTLIFLTSFLLLSEKAIKSKTIHCTEGEEESRGKSVRHMSWFRATFTAITWIEMFFFLYLKWLPWKMGLPVRIHFFIFILGNMWIWQIVWLQIYDSDDFNVTGFFKKIGLGAKSFDSDWVSLLGVRKISLEKAIFLISILSGQK